MWNYKFPYVSHFIWPSAPRRYWKAERSGAVEDVVVADLPVEIAHELLCRNAKQSFNQDQR
jgi:hypothetical protein